jgi:ATP-binding cassette, subfamily C, bacterial CydD
MASRPAADRAAELSPRDVQRRLTRFSRAARAHLVATVVLGAVATVLTVAQATLLAGVIAAVFLTGASLGDVTGELGWLAAIAVARGLVAAGFEATGRIGAARVMADLREALAAHLLRARPGGLAGERRGELAATAVQGVDALEAYFARYLPQVALAALSPLAILVWVAPRNWQAAAILAVTVPLIPVFMVLIGRLAERSTRARWQTLATLSARFLDVVSGLETLRAVGRAGAQEQAIAESSERYRRETMATLRVAFLSALVLELLAMLGVALVAVTIGVQLAGGSLQLEAGLTVLLLAPELYAPLRELGAQFHASADGVAAAGRVLEVLEQPPAVAVPDRPRPAPDPGRAPVELEDVRFSHAGRGEPVLDGARLTLWPGEIVALVGASGSGKTTLASLVLRLADPDAGRVTCGGIDLREVSAADWRRQIAWIPQRPTIFAASVADNIRLAAPGAGGHSVRQAARRSGVLELADTLPDGLETRVGEGGRRLSAGEAQRIALARAFLRAAPLVVLDEPTAHLDAESAALVDEALALLLRQRTALLIVHRRALAGRADRVVELRDGRIWRRPRQVGAEAAA